MTGGDADLQSTSDSIEVYETYHSALQHDNADLPSETWLAGVVNIEMYGFSSSVDVNLDALAPPSDVFDEFRNTKSGLEDDGVDGVEAHNTAWDTVDFEKRYREYLDDGWENNTAVREQCEAILDRLHDQPVALVCYEGSEKHCHRHVLRGFLDEKTSES